MKSYTDLEQSKKLAEILRIESADMRIGNYVGKSGKVDGTNVHYYLKGESFGAPEIIYAWSLAALLGVLPSRLFDSTPKRKELYLLPDLDKSYCFYRQFAVKTKGKIYLMTEGECLVDACYEMILKLHELNLL